MKQVVETIVQIAKLIEMFMASQNKSDSDKAPEPGKQTENIK